MGTGYRFGRILPPSCTGGSLTGLPPHKTPPATRRRSSLTQATKTVRGDRNDSDGSKVGTCYGLPADTPVFNVPTGLLRILDRDLKAAGIPKVDGRGRTVDVHALRHTFASHLSRAGVQPRTAQAAMRHSTIGLTMNTYTDPKLLDIHGAVERLPALPLDGSTDESEAATGTDDAVAGTARTFAPGFAPTPDNRRQSETFLSIGTADAMDDEGAEKCANPKEIGGFPEVCGALDQWAILDLNQRLPPCKNEHSSQPITFRSNVSLEATTIPTETNVTENNIDLQAYRQETYTWRTHPTIKGSRSQKATTGPLGPRSAGAPYAYPARSARKS